jgi:transcription factor TGA
LQSISPIDLATTAAAAAAAAAAITTVDPQALLQQKGAQPNLVAVRTRNNENWGESSMADTSPRTDTSTDPDIDIDDRNQMVPTIVSSTLCHSFSL